MERFLFETEWIKKGVHGDKSRLNEVVQKQRT